MVKKLINVSDLNKEDFFQIFKNIEFLKANREKVLLDKSIGLIFEKYSTRTRISFQVGIHQLFGNAIDIKFEELNLQRVETFEDTFKIFSCYLDAIVYRTDDHSKIEKAFNYFQKPIINALSDLSHPCQAISDIFTLKEKFGRMSDLNVVWMGDMNNVLYSFAEAADFLENMNITVFTDRSISNKKSSYFKKFKCISIKNELDFGILKHTDCVMTDVFISMNDVDSNKENLLTKFQVNSVIMDNTKDETVFMHCLPAKINSEVTEVVIRGPKSIVLKQAENRLHAQKGILKWLDI